MNRVRPQPSRSSARLPRPLRSALTLWCAGLAVAGAHAQGPPQLVVDLNQAASGGVALSGPSNGFRYGGHVYFSAFDPLHGVELWRTDGTAAGTILFKDINPGAGSSYPSGFARVGSVMLFQADDGGSGAELWRSDGTVTGTTLLMDINPGPAGSAPAGFPDSTNVFNPYTAFNADDGSHGRELWRTDGTAAGTSFVADIRPGVASSMTPTTKFTVAGISEVSFPANDGVRGIELWQTGFQSAVLVADINPGAASSTPESLGQGYWAADDGVHGRELFSSAGALVADVNGGSAASDPGAIALAYDGRQFRLVFAATTRAFGRELWAITGSNPPALLLDVVSGPAGSSPVLAIQQVPPPSGVGLFVIDTPAAGRELWKTDGTAAGTTLLRDINPGTADSAPTAFVDFDSGADILFRADDGTAGAELWKTDGTTAGTVLVKDINPGAARSDVQPLASMGSGANQRMLLSVPFGTGGSNPWISDGTAAGTTLLRTIGIPASGSEPLQITDHAGASFVLYQGTDGTTGRELWRSDGTAAGTMLVKDINPGTADGSPANFVHWNGLTYFSANDGVHNTELWVTDGTAAGTVMLKEIHVGPGFSTPNQFVAFAGLLFFSALDGNGRELWQTDGTAAGTVMVKDINPGSAGSAPGEFLAVGSTLYFTAATAAEGAELWKTDGTAAGTVLVKDINPGPAGSATISLTSRGHEKAALGSLLVFAVDLATHGLYRSDGTSAGTTWMAAGQPGYVPMEVRDLVAWNGRVYYSSDDLLGIYGREVGSADGAVNSVLRDLVPGAGSSAPTGLAVVGDQLLFSAATANRGRELYRSDGTAVGTTLVKDIYPGAASGVHDSAALPFRLATVPGADRAVFAASDGDAGVELWRTDGTAAGTVLHADLNPGAAGSFPQPFTAALATGLLFFAAAADATGGELYAMSSMAAVQAYGSGCPGTGGFVPGLGALGLPAIGNRAFALTVTRARASTAGVAFVGFGHGQLPLGGGCALHFNLLLPYVPLNFVVDGRGSASLAFPIPDERHLQGLAMFAQAAVVDPAGAFQGLVAFTGGLKMVVDG